MTSRIAVSAVLLSAAFSVQADTYDASAVLKRADAALGASGV